MLEALIDAHPETDFLIADGFDDAIIGYHPGSERLIYSISKAIKILIEEGMSHTWERKLLYGLTIQT